MTTNTRSSQRNILVTLVLLTVAVGLMAPAVEASDPTADRLQRKVKVMQRVIDEVLVQSEHVLVSPGGVTRGLVLEGYGVLFTLDASLGEALLFGEGFASGAGLFYGGSYGLFSGERVPEPDKRADSKDWEALKNEAKEKQSQDREALKRELTDTLLDYGVTLAELEDESWVTIAAFLGSWNLFSRDDVDDRIVVRVKMRDLRRYMTGSLSREEARVAVVVED